MHTSVKYVPLTLSWDSNFKLTRLPRPLGYLDFLSNHESSASIFCNNPGREKITTKFVIRNRFICCLHMCDGHCKKQMILICAIPQTRLLLGGIKLFKFEISKMYLRSFQSLYQSNWSCIYQLKIIAMVPNTAVDLELHLELHPEPHLSAPTRAASHRYHYHLQDQHIP